ncbi:GspH/FimT family pseudopilin [Sphingomonas sp.]|uniref:GspH/FimT family pseudopilin n=1 Tax=Sphingomonas sp. TaxID=28214 RepID=UPI0025D01618|nr:GspH/FimT family pseudopilin [Sphingomonas sp.]
MGRSAQQGFTLIELMIVITIIALMSALVVLALPDPRGRLIDEAERFAARARTAHDLAIVEGHSISLWVSRDGYGFERRERGSWVAIDQRPLVQARWAGGVAPALADASGRARVTFDSTGLASAPLVVDLRRDAITTRVTIGSDGRVTVNG